ncbi:MAG TPA: hypothetical protein VLT33_20700, partial [Labilithrix sp.]|nr:hypothetical protein [Labilithrix sp.]
MKPAVPPPSAGSFEDEPTRELPSSLRTFTDLAPVSEIDAADILEVHETAEHTVRLARPRSLPAFVLDVRPPAARELSRLPLGLVVAMAMLVACLFAGAVGIAAGRTLSPKGSARQAPQARAVVIAAASELVTLPPLSAPAKIAVVTAPAPRPP